MRPVGHGEEFGAREVDGVNGKSMVEKYGEIPIYSTLLKIFVAFVNVEKETDRRQVRCINLRCIIAHGEATRIENPAGVNRNWWIITSVITSVASFGGLAHARFIK